MMEIGQSMRVWVIGLVALIPWPCWICVVASAQNENEVFQRIILVRHAHKAGSGNSQLTNGATHENCGSCQAKRLKVIVGQIVDKPRELLEVYATDSCRTVQTVYAFASDQQLNVTVFYVNGYRAASFSNCKEWRSDLVDKDSRKRPAARRNRTDLVSELQDRSDRFMALVADHSGHIDTWIETLEVDGDETNDCMQSALNVADKDYGDIWLLDRAAGGTKWTLSCHENKFSLAE